MNADYPTFLLSSVLSHFKTNQGSLNIFAPEESRPSNLQGYILIHVPHLDVITLGDDRYLGEVIAAVENQITNDIYANVRDSGAVAALFYDFPVMDNNNNAIGCLQFDGKIVIENMGQLRAAVKVSRSMVSCHYRFVP